MLYGPLEKLPASQATAMMAPLARLAASNRPNPLPYQPEANYLNGEATPFRRGG